MHDEERHGRRTGTSLPPLGSSPAGQIRLWESPDHPCRASPARYGSPNAGSGIEARRTAGWRGSRRPTPGQPPRLTKEGGRRPVLAAHVQAHAEARQRTGRRPPVPREGSMAEERQGVRWCSRGRQCSGRRSRIESLVACPATFGAQRDDDHHPASLGEAWPPRYRGPDGRRDHVSVGARRNCGCDLLVRASGRGSRRRMSADSIVSAIAV